MYDNLQISSKMRVVARRVDIDELYTHIGKDLFQKIFKDNLVSL